MGQAVRLGSNFAFLNDRFDPSVVDVTPGEYAGPDEQYSDFSATCRATSRSQDTRC
jgi:hypothetical protein